MISLNLREAEESARYWQQVNDRLSEACKKLRDNFPSAMAMAKNFEAAALSFRRFRELFPYETRKAMAVLELVETLKQVKLQKTVKYRDVLEFCERLGVDPFGIRKEIK